MITTLFLDLIYYLLDLSRNKADSPLLSDCIYKLFVWADKYKLQNEVWSLDFRVVHGCAFCVTFFHNYPNVILNKKFMPYCVLTWNFMAIGSQPVRELYQHCC